MKEYLPAIRKKEADILAKIMADKAAKNTQAWLFLAVMGCRGY